MSAREQPPAPVYERELTQTVSSSADRWLTELRLAVIGVIISVGIGAADIGLSAGGWVAALAAGIGSVVILVGLLWSLRPRAPTRVEPAAEDFRRIGQELADIRAALDAPRDPTRELLDALAAQLDLLAEQLDRIANEAYLDTESGEALRRVRAYDADLHDLSGEIRSRRTGRR